MGSQSPEHVSKEDEMRFQDLFNKFDRNHDGRIDIDEMIATLNIPGASGEDQTKVSTMETITLILTELSFCNHAIVNLLNS